MSRKKITFNDILPKNRQDYIITVAKNITNSEKDYDLARSSRPSPT